MSFSCQRVGGVHTMSRRTLCARECHNLGSPIPPTLVLNTVPGCSQEPALDGRTGIGRHCEMGADRSSLPYGMPTGDHEKFRRHGRLGQRLARRRGVGFAPLALHLFFPWNECLGGNLGFHGESPLNFVRSPVAFR